MQHGVFELGDGRTEKVKVLFCGYHFGTDK